MLEVIKYDNGEIKGCLEWYLVDNYGYLDDKGRFVWINKVYISPSARNDGCLKKFVQIITSKAPHAEYGYFWRQDKYKDRIRMYHRNRWLKLLGGENVD